MNKFDFINWELTVAQFGYTNKKLRPNDNVIINCHLCNNPYIITFSSIRNRKKDQQYQPLCKSCLQKNRWKNDSYRSKQSKAQSKAVKKLWTDTDYRNNITNKAKQNTTELWTDADYRNRVTSSIKEKHANDDEYKSKAVSALKLSKEARIAAIKDKYATDPEYRAKLSAAAKRNWEDPEYRDNLSKTMKSVWSNDGLRQRMSELYRGKQYNNLFREMALAKWKDYEFVAKVMSSFTSERKEKASQTSKALWNNADYRNIMSFIQSSSEYRAKLSAAAKRNWEDPEYRNKMIDLYKSPEYKSMMSAIAKKLWEDPEYVERVTKHFKSKQEEILSSILSDMNIKFERQKLIGHWPFDFIIYHNSRTILVEVQGDYWHTLKKQQTRDAAKSTYIANYHPDYELKTIWEHDFLSPQRTIDIIGGWLGFCVHEKIDFNITDTNVDIVDDVSASLLFSKYHYMANGGRSGINIGVTYGDSLIGCARYCNPTRDQSATRLKLKQKEILELTRFVIHPSYQKKNLASYLLSRTIKIIRITKPSIKCLLTFADKTFGHSGTIYKAANWQHDATIRPDYFYVNCDGHVMHKKTMWDHAKKMCKNETEYAASLGYIRKYGKQKERFIYWL